MGEHDAASEHRRFGRYLRRVREQRRLSLDAVEELSVGYPERVTKSHLSRIENGQAVPTFPRMFALSQIYGIPIASVAEKFEIDLQLEMEPPDLEDKTVEQVLEELDRFKLAGRYSEGLSLASGALERLSKADDPAAERSSLYELKLHQINCLVHLQRYESAKVECEELLNREGLSHQQSLFALLSFVTCCYRLRRFTIAGMGLERADRELESGDLPVRTRAVTETIRGPVYFAMGRLDDAAAAFERALEMFRSLGDPWEACRARVNLSQCLIEQGEPGKARAHLRQALRAAEAAGYDRQTALALSHMVVACYRMGEHGSAEAYALRSNTIARPREYFTIIFRNCYYLREIAVDRGDETAIRSNERSLKAYLGRVEPDMPEAIQYRARLAGGAQ